MSLSMKALMLYSKAKEADGLICKTSASGIYSISIDGVPILSDEDRSCWDVLGELINYGVVESMGYKGEAYRVK